MTIREQARSQSFDDSYVFYYEEGATDPVKIVRTLCSWSILTTGPE
jgi:hypothetical protein